jgi:hypothetical protein
MSQSPRNQRLAELAAMVVNGEQTYKLDHIATIHIDGRHYFTVFRRYNSPYNIVVEDYNADFYLFQNERARQTIANILCLSEGEEHQLTTKTAFSFKHNGEAPLGASGEMLDMSWLEVQAQFEALNVNLYPFGNYNDTPRDDVKEEDDGLSTPRDQIIEPQQEPPGAPPRPYTQEDYRAAHLLLTISIPQVDDPLVERECDGKPLSLRRSDRVSGQKRRREPMCYCDFHSDEEYEEQLASTDDEVNYTILRNGTMIPKATY